jgi:phosphoribosylglycinamide formyltransferase-1
MSNARDVAFDAELPEVAELGDTAAPSTKMKIGVLLSGSGTNLQAILDAQAAGAPYEVVQVVSSRPDAYGIERARAAGVPTLVLNRDVYSDVAAADAQIADTLMAAGVQYIAMAGYMRRVTNVLLDAFPDRIINLHPALLPSFKGAHAINDAWEAGVKVTGITVHFANEDYDKGPIIAQRAIDVRESDTIDTLEARIHEAEHELYPAVLTAVAQGRVTIDEARKVHVYE